MNDRRKMFVSDEELDNEVEQKKTPQQQVEELNAEFMQLELPSMGKLGYPYEVEYRDIYVEDEKALALATPNKYFQVMNSVLKSLMNNPSWFDDMVLHDRDFALLWIWANNYSPVKKVDVRCDNPECGHVDVKPVDLTKLNVDHIDDDYEPLEFNLKKTGDPVTVNMITVGDEQTVLNFFKDEENQKKFDYDTVIYAVSLDIGKRLPLEDKIRYVEKNVRGKEMAIIRSFHEHYRFGVNSKLKHECSACGEVKHFNLPFQIEWLRPSVPDDLEEMLQSRKQAKDQSTGSGQDESA